MIRSLGFLDGKYSHNNPPKKLLDHLEGVLKIAENINRFHKLDLNIEEIALTHDIAKSHVLFQDRLNGKQRYFEHSEPSAFFLLNATKDILQAEIVRRHHTKIMNLREIINFWNSEDLYSKFVKIKEFAGSDFEILSEDELKKLAFQFLIQQHDMKDWLKFKSKYSILITADRFDASNAGEMKFETPKLDSEKINKYISSIPKNALSEWREGIRKETIKIAEEKVKGPGLYTLTLPTGAGKTIIGLQIASMISKKFNLNTIIYVLPFISIVQQNADVAKNIFERVQEDHHLFNLNHDTHDTEQLTSMDKFILSFRYWIDPVVVTTFVKFWETLYSPYSNDTMNFHRLKSAIVILDEPQSLDSKLWAGFGKTIEFLSKEYGTFFILMTATQPEMAKGIELAPSVTIPNSRHTYKIIKDKKKIEDLSEFLDFKDSGLMVFNTRKSALKAYELFSKKFEGKVFFLSTWVIPIERKEKLEQIKKLENNNELRTLISTQVVEAGVDLDFNWTFRDIGPMDSIIQVAGRCNRNMKKKNGKITIASLIDENGKSFASLVYGQVLISKTEEVLSNVEQFSEQEVPKILSEYYERVIASISQDGPWYHIERGEWGYYEELFNERDESLVFVDIDGTVEVALHEFNEMDKDIKNIPKRKQIWKNLQNYAINVPQKYMEEWREACNGLIIDDSIPEVEEVQHGIWLIRQSGIGKIYLKDKGFIPLKKDDLDV
ncbi:MAG: CRISPR-associated helicase Cas3' [Athalassotoga sp.]